MKSKSWIVVDIKTDVKKVAQDNGYKISKVFSCECLSKSEVYASLSSQFKMSEFELAAYVLQIPDMQEYNLYRVRLEKNSFLKNLFFSIIPSRSEGWIISKQQ